MKVPEKATYMWARKEDTGLVLREDTPILYEFNSLACRIWELIDGNNSINDIINQIVEQFSDQDATEIVNDVKSFLEELEENKLITFSES